MLCVQNIILSLSFQQYIHRQLCFIIAICLQCASVHLCICNTHIGVIWLEWENIFKLLKKIHTVSSAFSVNGSMLYISIKKTINFCSMDDIYLFLHCIFFFYNIR